MAPNSIRLFYSVNTHIILEESRDDNDKEEGFHYFKFDKNANVIDILYAEGTGYFDIPLLNDTLKVKKSNLIVEEATPADPKTRYYLSNGKKESVSPFHINVYTNPVLNFAIYSTSKHTVYTIRKKQKQTVNR